MPALKEPHYFTTPLMVRPTRGPGDEIFFSNRRCLDAEEYRDLFQHAGEATAVGEASADYLYFKEAAAEIRRELGDVRIIIALRDPVERAYSNYRHMRRDGLEKKSFEAALADESRRIQDNWHWMWHYRAQGFYADAVAEYQRLFSRVQIVWFEDIERQFSSVARELFEFLEIEEIGVPGRFHENASEVPASLALREFMNRPHPAKTWFRRAMEGTLSKSATERLLAKIRRWNRRSLVLDQEARRSLSYEYRTDIDALEKLTGRNLDNWRHYAR